MKNILLILFLVCLSFPTVTFARLGDTVDVSEKRYGKPIINPADKVNPVMKNVRNESYSYKGWRIRAAYINDHVVRIQYVRESKPDISPLLQDYEIQAILKAEAHGGTWEKMRKKSLVEEAIFKTNHPNKNFVHAKASWKNTNGCIAYTPIGILLYVESPDASRWESAMANAKVEKSKQDVPEF